jgi:PadR family transcriptional regulator PadR
MSHFRSLFRKLLTKLYLFAINEDMAEQRFLGEFELMILLAILRLENVTYGVPLARELSDLRGRDVSLGSVYATLDRLELKGLVKSTLGESTPERGGRAKRFFTVTAAGVRSLHETRRVLSVLWKKLPPGKGEMA